MQCRPGCGACCIAPSISTPIPTLDGSPARPKAAGDRCVQLGSDGLCGLFGSPLRPAVCGGLQPSFEMCGASAREAMVSLERLLRATRPDPRATSPS
jgi:hypothetical protein